MKSNSNSSIYPLLVIGGMFFILGFITWLNGILITHLKIACELSDFQSLFVAFAFYISYTIMALPSSWILNKIGFKKGISVALWIMAIGALVFIPAALTRVYFYFLSGLFVLGTGMALLQTAVNPYITVLGPIESAAKRISIMGTANKIAGIISPAILGAFVLKNSDKIEAKLQTDALFQSQLETASQVWVKFFHSDSSSSDSEKCIELIENHIDEDADFFMERDSIYEQGLKFGFAILCLKLN